MPRYFTLAEAEAVLPAVERHIQQAVHLKQEHDAAQTAQQEFQRKVAMAGGMQVDRGQFLAIRTKRDATVARLNEILTELGEMGVQIKDLDTGLLDFPTFYHGDEVLLCWRLGEEGIHFWHNLTDGFRGRRQIDDEFLRNHKNHE